MKGNTAVFSTEGSHEEKLPEAGLQTHSKASEASEMMPVAVGEVTAYEAKDNWK